MIKDFSNNNKLDLISWWSYLLNKIPNLDLILSDNSMEIANAISQLGDILCEMINQLEDLDFPSLGYFTKTWSSDKPDLKANYALLMRGKFKSSLFKMLELLKNTNLANSLSPSIRLIRLQENLVNLSKICGRCFLLIAPFKKEFDELTSILMPLINETLSLLPSNMSASLISVSEQNYVKFINTLYNWIASNNPVSTIPTVNSNHQSLVIEIKNILNELHNIENNSEKSIRVRNESLDEKLNVILIAIDNISKLIDEKGDSIVKDSLIQSWKQLSLTLSENINKKIMSESNFVRHMESLLKDTCIKLLLQYNDLNQMVTKHQLEVGKANIHLLTESPISSS